MCDIFMSLAERAMKDAEKEGKFESAKYKGKKIEVRIDPFSVGEWQVLATISKECKVLPREIEIKNMINTIDQELKGSDLSKEERKALATKRSLMETEFMIKMENLLKK
jgi:hypothetical protein